jgi:hypothetical protein
MPVPVLSGYVIDGTPSCGLDLGAERADDAAGGVGEDGVDRREAREVVERAHRRRNQLDAAFVIRAQRVRGRQPLVADRLGAVDHGVLAGRNTANEKPCVEPLGIDARRDPAREVVELVRRRDEAALGEERRERLAGEKPRAERQHGIVEGAGEQPAVTRGEENSHLLEELAHGRDPVAMRVVRCVTVARCRPMLARAAAASV